MIQSKLAALALGVVNLYAQQIAVAPVAQANTAELVCLQLIAGNEIDS